MPLVAIHQTEPAGLQLLQRLGVDLVEKLLGREALELAIVEGDQDVGGFGQTVDHSAAVRHASGKAKKHLHTTAYGKPRRQLCGSALFFAIPLLPSRRSAALAAARATSSTIASFFSFTLSAA